MDNSLNRQKTWPLRLVITSEVEDVPAWELLETGRYMPRRIRGSYRGRELG